MSDTIPSSSFGVKVTLAEGKKPCWAGDATFNTDLADFDLTFTDEHGRISTIASCTQHATMALDVHIADAVHTLLPTKA
jgi:hypothetical protein